MKPKPSRHLSLFTLAAFAVSLSPLSAEVPALYSTEFGASEGYETGDLDGQKGWTVFDGSADVSQASNGEGSVRFGGDGTPARIGVAPLLSGEDVAYVTFRFRPVADDDLFASTLIDLERAALRFLRSGDYGYVCVLHGDGEGGVEWWETAARFSVDSDGLSQEFLSVTVRLDYEHNLWDLWVEERLEDFAIGLDIGPPDALEIVLLTGHRNVPAELSSLRVSSEAPGFLDPYTKSDDDSLDSSNQEPAGFLITGGGHGHESPGGIAESFETDHEVDIDSGSLGDTGLIYVNNRFGNDANSGRRSTADLTRDGPKATIQAAAHVSVAGDRIIVERGASPYETNAIPSGTIVSPGVRIAPGHSS
jgi:hypothetical protein